MSDLTHHGHKNSKGDPKIKYRNRADAKATCDRRGWFIPYKCGQCDGWHIARHSWANENSRMNRKWRAMRPYQDLMDELGVRVTVQMHRENYLGPTRRIADLMTRFAAVEKRRSRPDREALPSRRAA